MQVLPKEDLPRLRLPELSRRLGGVGTSSPSSSSARAPVPQSRGAPVRAPGSRAPPPRASQLEKPDGTVEVLARYKTKPKLNEVSELVRTESFKRYAIGNDRWMSGRM